MKFYSEKTHQLYDTKRAAEDAERKYDAEIAEKERAEALAKAERKADADRVEEARKAKIAADKAYTEALRVFCEKHGAYHCSYSLDDLADVSLDDLLADIFGF